MIAWAAMPRFLAGEHDDYTQEIMREWNIESLDTVSQGEVSNPTSEP
jgi:hypothetical protein